MSISNCEQPFQGLQVIFGVQGETPESPSIYWGMHIINPINYNKRKFQHSLLLRESLKKNH